MRRKNFIVKLLLVSALIAVAFTISCKKADNPQPKANGTDAQPTAGKVADQQKSATSNELVPIDLELPKPMFIGTPQNIRVAKLEKPLGKARPAFLAPAGTKLISRDKPVTSSDEEPIIGEVSMVTDGDKEASDGSYVEFFVEQQYVSIDLEAEYEIYAIVVWHFHKQARAYFDVIVQIANDPDFIESQTVFNNDIDNSAGFGIGEDMHYIETSEGKLIDAKGTQGRYVRLYSNGNNSNDLNHYIEVEVFGKPVE